jgi:hypothetical protein
MKIDVTFKHSRFDLIQAIYGKLDEDSSLLAVESTETRLESLFKEINEASKDGKHFTDSMAIEMCLEKAETMEELLIFIHKVSAKIACPQHPFIEMMQMPRGGGGE